ncbi:MAG: hypothetical protein Q9217_006247 [Psora testacea]
MESAAKQAVKEMTEDDKALLALFEEYRRTQRSAHGATGIVDFHSGPSEDQMVVDGDQEALEFLQAFASVQEEQAKLGSEDEEYEDSAGGDAGGEATTGKLKELIIVSSRKKTPELLLLRLFRYVRVQKRRSIYSLLLVV